MRLPKHLYWQSDKLYCRKCYPAHTIRLPVREKFDVNVQSFIEMHRGCDVEHIRQILLDVVEGFRAKEQLANIEKELGFSLSGKDKPRVKRIEK
jgi:hypothetical protein